MKPSKIGFMQGRLVAPYKKKIQYFPSTNWKLEMKLAQKNKFKLMEWTVNYKNLLSNPLFNDKKLNEIKKNSSKYKVKIKSVTCDVFMEKPFFKTNSFLNKNINILKKIIMNGQKIGINLFILPLVDNSSIKNKKEENFLLKIIKKKIIPILNDKSMILFEIDYTPKKILNFLKKFSNNKIGINYDSGNSAGQNFDVMNESIYFKYVKNVHIKDKKKFGKTIRLGMGNCNFKKLFKVLKKNNYNGNLILQTARAKNNSHIYELNRNLNFLKSFL